MKQTVYPTKGDGFPPASFWRLADALMHAAKMAGEQHASGVGMCPARSFNLHWRGAK